MRCRRSRTTSRRAFLTFVLVRYLLVIVRPGLVTSTGGDDKPYIVVLDSMGGGKVTAVNNQAMIIPRSCGRAAAENGVQSRISQKVGILSKKKIFFKTQDPHFLRDSRLNPIFCGRATA